MMRKPGLMLLVLLVLIVWGGCSQDNSVLNDLTAQIDALQNEVQLLKENLDSLGQLNLKINTLNRQIGVLQDRIDGLDDLKAQVDFLDSQVKVQADQDSLNDLRAEIDLLNNQLKVLVLQASPNKTTLGRDGAEMALISAGSFQMGDSKNEPESWMKRSRPVHTVELDAFYMDVNEVTVGQFKQFVNQSGYKYGGDWNDVAKYSPGDDYPMVHVNWDDATAYAKWAGKRLPTEAEWEYAARGRLIGKRYPLGDEMTDDDANWSNTAIGKDKWEYCSPVGSFEANGYGLYDMAGNVYEWCADWYDEGYYSISPAKNPLGPDSGLYRVLRGGFWDNYTNTLWIAYRGGTSPFNRINDLGFRCVSTAPR
ncbi:MAG: SUMF1/EgtB/PvdO family nonheme iron enzyme [Candidatus Poribacteria bacterium]|nr:SUMF1/EgtB/PvdO family nonheme iron enzyme [Candidatus Poribacteria bacterium]